MHRQFVACKFRTTDARSFTYHNDGPPVADGDWVKVPDRSGDGWKKVYVSDANAPKPTAFETKPILGMFEPEAPATDLLAMAADAPSRNDPAPTLDIAEQPWRPFQPGDSVPQHGMFEVHYRDADAHKPETMPAGQINWQKVARFRNAGDDVAQAPLV